MMENRIIKFRYWDGFNEVMQYSQPERWEDYLSKFFIEFDSAKEGGNDPKLMQFTSLHDKNGKEIYEGDVVQTNFDLKGEIVFNAMASQWWIELKHDRNRYKPLTPDFGDGKNYCQYLEIIGNIYEAPNLVKRKLTVKK